MLLAILLSVSAFAGANSGEQQDHCEIRVAEALEISGEAPAAVADAAIVACSQLAPKAPPNSLYAMMPLEERERTDNLRSAIARQRLSLALIRLRACRKVEACNPTQPLSAFYSITPTPEGS